LTPRRNGDGHDVDVERRTATVPSDRREWSMPGPISFLFCAVNATICVAAFSPFLKGQQTYTDLIGGTLAWTGADKGFDFRLFYTFLATFGILFGIVVSLFKRFGADAAMKKALERVLALSLTPAALWIGRQITTNSLGAAPIESLFAGGAVLAVLFVIARRRIAIEPETIGDILVTSLSILLFAFFGALGIATALTRVAHVGTEGETMQLVAVGCGVAFLAILAVILLSPTTEKIRSRVRQIVFASQLPLPLLCAVVMPPAIVEPDHKIIWPTSTLLLLLTILMMAVSWTALARRWFNSNDKAATFHRAFVPLAIVPIAIFIATQHPVYPTLFGDDFHTGEHILPWQQLRDFGKLPFVGFVPIHALMDFFVSGANQLFFDGTLANYENGRAILFAIGAGITFLTVSRFGNVTLALCLAFAANLWDRLLFAPALFAVLCSASLMANSRRWIICWFCLCPLAVGYNPAAGIALTLASLPIAIIQFRNFFENDRDGCLRVIALVGVAAAAIFIAPATRAMSLGFLNFLIENGRNVVLMNGIEWQQRTSQLPAERGLLATPLVWSAFQFSWIVVLLVAAWIFFSRARNWRFVRPQVLAISSMIALFLLVLAGWTLTRLDPFSPSRPGEVSYLACLYFLPLLLFTFGVWRKIAIPVFAVAIGFFQGATNGFINSGSKPHTCVTFASLLELPGTRQNVSPNCIVVDGKAMGFPNLGRIYIPEREFERITSFKSELARFLRPGETYLDLTGRQAFYFFLGLPSPTSYGAAWVAANSVLQDRSIAEIKSNPPPVVWLAPNWFSGAETPPLRIYKLYRFLVQNYVPFFHNGYSFLIAPGRIGNDAADAKTRIQILRDAFGEQDLGSVPIVWGNSWIQLQHNFVEEFATDAGNSTPTTAPSIPLRSATSHASGDKTDFVKFDFLSNTLPTAKTPVAIVWKSENGPGRALFYASNGTNLIPLGAISDWLLSRDISDVQLIPIAPPHDFAYVVRNIEFLRLKD
jgi:uncharacterized membrane protein